MKPFRFVYEDADDLAQSEPGETLFAFFERVLPWPVDPAVLQR